MKRTLKKQVCADLSRISEKQKMVAKPLGAIASGGFFGKNWENYHDFSKK